jgi:hypothetical protein
MADLPNGIQIGNEVGIGTTVVFTPGLPDNNDHIILPKHISKCSRIQILLKAFTCYTHVRAAISYFLPELQRIYLFMSFPQKGDHVHVCAFTHSLPPSKKQTV